MSIWTHVAGIIRIDDMRCFHTKNPKCEIKKVINTTPTGSEGGLKYNIYINPNKTHLAAYVVSIWGDLRDYKNSDEVKNWFMDLCDKLGETFCGIRNAVITIEVDGNETITEIYKR